MFSTPSYFNFQPLNPSLSFPNDLITIPIAISSWATLHFLLSKTLFLFIQEKVYKFKSEIDRLKYQTAGKLSLGAELEVLLGCCCCFDVAVETGCC